MSAYRQARNAREDHSQNQKIEVEVILIEAGPHHLVVKADEDARPQRISRWSAKIIERKPRSVIIEMPESRAIACNLV